MYIHELNDWPHFYWSAEKVADPLASVRHRQGRLTGHMEALGFHVQQEAVLQTLTADVTKSSEIEGEKLNAEQVRSSIARRSGMDIGAFQPVDRSVEGVVEMMLDATRHYNQPLTAERLFAWHGSLFPTGRSGLAKIARAIADMALARSENSPQRFYSMSAQIRQERDAYYDVLEHTQKGAMDVTPWIEWFLGCLGRAIDEAQVALSTVRDKARFWDRIKNLQLNPRQRLMISRLLDGFAGNLTTSKYTNFAKCSQDTAHRDILELVERRVLVQNPEGGRSTSYSLVLLH